ncbi:hypothetical protein [Stenotrophomonas maltophilia]|uniref:hypothetical protein n=1 Tax=Stenotrophomonas maltophilia TaxID=40324 RepID=UPI0012FD59C2|nr:hypothetical protein [Stenotrophomonas maltophilia]
MMLLGAVSAGVVAQERYENLVYRCVNKAGTQYQSQPCAKGETDHIRLADPAPSPEAAAANERYLESLRRRNAASIAPRPAPTRPVYRNGGGGARLHSISQYKDPDACEAAKAERERVFRMYGSNRPYMVGRRMDDMVWSACK